MPGLKDDAKSSGPGKSVTDSPHGMDATTENSFISSLAHMGEAIPLTTANGDVEEATDAIASAITPARSSPLSAADEQRLYRIRKDMSNGFMVSSPDVAFLLEIVERMSR